MKAVSSAFPHCCIPWKLQGQCTVEECKPAFPQAVSPAHLDLDAEDGPVLSEAEGLQPRQVGKAHRITAQRVHVLVTATLCHSRGQTAPTGTLALGCLRTLEPSHSPGGVWEQAWKDRTGQDTQFSSFSQLCTCPKLPSPLLTPGFSLLKTVPGTGVSQELLLMASSQLIPKKVRPETARKWIGQQQAK